MDWLYEGVNKTVARNAGPECAAFLTPKWRLVESVIVLIAASVLFVWSYCRVMLPATAYVRKDRGGKSTVRWEFLRAKTQGKCEINMKSVSDDH